MISPGLEFWRKARTFLRGITALLANFDLLNPFTYRRFAFQLASHKLLRFLAPFSLLIMLGTAGLLMAEQSYRLLFWFQTTFYAVGMIGGLVPMFQRNRIIRVASYFSMVQGAMLVAWCRFLLGHHQTTWEPSKRPKVATTIHDSSH